MTVAELIAELQKMPQGMPVWAAVDYELGPVDRVRLDTSMVDTVIGAYVVVE